MVIKMAIDSGDTAWVLASTALVLLMIPAVGLFYGGMVRSKNILSTIMMSFAILGMISLQWILFGYSLAFGTDVSGLIGNLEFVGLNGVGQEAAGIAPTIPHLAFMLFQAMFAVITPVLITGALVERIKFSGLLVFTLLWSTIVYDPIAHWVWGGGWLGELGALDFAGGFAVHIASGVSALAIVMVIGARRGFGRVPMEPSNIPLTLVGVILLWFGWFGFNGGSALGANGLAASTIVVTNTSAAAGAFTWMLLSWRDRRPSVLGIATGAVAGLAAITPASGFVTPLSAIVIGTVAGGLCYKALLFRINRGFDESLDVWAVHGMGSTWGVLAIGIFASTMVNPAGGNGLFYGNSSLLGIQGIATISVWIYSFVVTWILAKAVDSMVGLRVRDEEEEVGLDISQHGEVAYA